MFQCWESWLKPKVCVHHYESERWCWCGIVSKHITDYLLPLFLFFLFRGLRWHCSWCFLMERRHLRNGQKQTLSTVLVIWLNIWPVLPTLLDPPKPLFSRQWWGCVYCDQSSCLPFIYYAVCLMVKNIYGWKVFSSGYLKVFFLSNWMIFNTLFKISHNFDSSFNTGSFQFIIKPGYISHKTNCIHTYE